MAKKKPVVKKIEEPGRASAFRLMSMPARPLILADIVLSWFDAQIEKDKENIVAFVIEDGVQIYTTDYAGGSRDRPGIRVTWLIANPPQKDHLGRVSHQFEHRSYTFRRYIENWYDLEDSGFETEVLDAGYSHNFYNCLRVNVAIEQ